MLTAVCVRATAISAGVRFGNALSSSAPTPQTHGVAADVPLSNGSFSPPGRPGPKFPKKWLYPARSGFRWKIFPGPWDE
jgi:hypothetical protein